MTLAANGVTGSIDLQTAWAVAGILEATGRTIPRRKWVDEFRKEDDLMTTFNAIA